MLICQEESWTEAREEILPLAAAHWAEMPFDAELPLRPHERLYAAREEHGGLLVVTARDAGTLVGYFVCFVARHPHYDLRTAAMDVYFLAPEHRVGGNALRLFGAMEDACRRHGVGLLLATARLDRGQGAMRAMEWLGWRPTRTVYEKRIGGKHG